VSKMGLSEFVAPTAILLLVVLAGQPAEPNSPCSRDDRIQREAQRSSPGEKSPGRTVGR
jgi:hypothetical protein